MNTFNYFYGVTILQLVLRHSDNFFLSGEINCWFDTANNKFTLIRKWIWITLGEIWITLLEITQPFLPHTNENDQLNFSMRTKRLDMMRFLMWRHFTDALRMKLLIQLHTNCIKTQLSQQPGYIKNINQLILNVINGLEYQNQQEVVLPGQGEEISHYRLSTHLQILKTVVQHWYTKKFLLRNNCFVKIISCVASNECCNWTISFFNASH